MENNFLKDWYSFKWFSINQLQSYEWENELFLYTLFLLPIIYFLKKILSRVTNLPTIVDIDTGFKSCKETIETFEEFGISAVHLEDQVERKRCGHLDNKELITTEGMWH